MPAPAPWPECRVLELVEYSPLELPYDHVSVADGKLLWERFGKKVDVTFPNPATNNRWRLESQGWVGYIPLSSGLALSLRPRTPLGNIFRMLEYAYRLESFQFLDGLYDTSSIEDMYERLANILASRVLDRARRGLYRAYVSDADELPYVRGSLELAQRLRRPWGIHLPCQFQEHTSDVEENRILLWALHSAMRSGICSERVLPTVRRAFRTLQSSTNLSLVTAAECANRDYNRLNLDYQPLHALARFLIEQSGPSTEWGDRRMVPYLVSMAPLFEQFVAQWLVSHLPAHLAVKAQENYSIDGSLAFRIDMVLYDRATGQPLAVLDTKYKTPVSPALADVSQVVSYAVAKGCSDAVLVYPTHLEHALDARVGNVRVRTATFDLSGDLEAAGRDFLARLT
jgi:5-methylcytosine-specific restriction enzyme subunit McrC